MFYPSQAICKVLAKENASWDADIPRRNATRHITGCHSQSSQSRSTIHFPWHSFAVSLALIGCTPQGYVLRRWAVGTHTSASSLCTASADRLYRVSVYLEYLCVSFNMCVSFNHALRCLLNALVLLRLLANSLSTRGRSRHSRRR